MLVDLITVDDEDDYIVSFYIVSSHDPTSGRSITLHRHRKWEHLIPAEEKGVTVSDDGLDDGSNVLSPTFLKKIAISNSRAHLESERARYELDLTQVEPSEIADAKSVLERMNFDRRFELKLA